MIEPRLIECVPNFSEGRDLAKVEKIVNVFRQEPDVNLIGLESDFDHNRTVLTCIGQPEAVGNAAFNACKKAMSLLDLSKHNGVHPRIGLMDVIPFVPLRNTSMQDCADLAHHTGARIAKDLQIPVFYYESAAKSAANANLADIRKSVRLNRYISDDGPSTLHPTAGGVAIGARNILVAFNVNLMTEDIKFAKEIAGKIRERDGGLPGIKALGLSIKNGKTAQVSMNITDYKKTTIKDVYKEIKRLAGLRGIQISNSELIGLAPADAFGSASPEALQITGMKYDKILDTHLKNISG